jgi:hypothetical protein
LSPYLPVSFYFFSLSFCLSVSLSFCLSVSIYWCLSVSLCLIMFMHYICVPQFVLDLPLSLCMILVYLIMKFSALSLYLFVLCFRLSDVSISFFNFHNNRI